MPLWKRINALLVVVLGVVSCSDPPVAPVPAGKALGQAEADSTRSDATTDSPAPAVVSFADANLELAVRRTLNKPEGPLTADDLASLTRLDVERQDVSGIESLAGLEHATALDTLNLWGNAVADLSPLAGLTQLTHLNLGHNQVADVGALAGLTNLKWLSLWGNQIADVRPLAGLTKLTYLNLWGNAIEAVSALAGLTKLTSLDLGHNAVADVRPLDGLTRLDWLGLVDNLIRQPDLAAQVPTLIEQDVKISVVLPNPQPPAPPPAPAPPPTPAPPPAPVVVSFADANLEGAVREALDKPEGELTSADLASLTRLEADDLNIESLAGLEHATALSYLTLIGNPISDVSPLASLTKLEELDLNGTSIGDAGVASLSSLTNLTWLDLGGTSIGDAGVAELTSLTKLEELNLHSTSIGDAGVASLSSLTKLEELGLSNTSITDVSPLLSLTNLQWLWLRRVTTLSAASINTHIPALEAAGVTVTR